MTTHTVDLEAAGMVGEDASTANQGVHDNSPVWNRAIATAPFGATLVLPPGYISFKSALTPLPSNVRLLGAGTESHMVRCFSQGNGDIFLTTGVTDSSVENVRLWAADGTTGGWAIGRVATSPNDAPFRTVIRGLETTRFNTGSWYGGTTLDGILGAPQYGSRRHEFHDIFLGCTTYIGMWLGGVNAVSGTNMTLAGSAPNPEWGLWCYGTATQPSNLVNFSGPMNCSVLFYSTNSSAINASALQQLIVDGNSASNVFVVGYMGATPNLIGPNNHAIVNGRLV